jgi:hypothetical protein
MKLSLNTKIILLLFGLSLILLANELTDKHHSEPRGVCGSAPMTPLPPLGCKTLDPICLCDEKAENCFWKFACKQ